jgi:hypothetical protein
MSTHLLFLCAVAEFKLVEVDPCVAQVGFQLDRSGKPLSALLSLPLGPKEFGHCQQNVRLVVALGEGVDRTLLPTGSRFHENALRPEDARCGTLLKGPRQKRLGLRDR